MASDEIAWKLRHQNLNSRLYSAETAFRAFLTRSNRERDEWIPFDQIESLNLDVEQMSRRLSAKVERLKIVCNALKWQKLLTLADGKQNEEWEKSSDGVKDAIHLFKMEGNLIMTDLIQQEQLFERQISNLSQSYSDQDKKPSKKEKTPKKLKPRFAHAQTKNLPEEVLEFQEFMHLTRKHQQEWSDAEHNRFLKLWRCKKLVPDLMIATVLELPSKFPNEIVSHIEWYKQFLKKKESKINALKEWKDQREKKQLDEVQRSMQEMKDKESKWKVNHLKIVQQRNDKVLNMFSTKSDKEKAVKQARDEERKKARQKFLQQRKLQQKKALRLKMIINEYHEQKRKLDVEAAQHCAGSARGRSFLEAALKPKQTKDFANYWKRDKMIVYQRKHRIDEKIKRSLPPKITAKNKGKRDPSRIFELTTSCKAKISHKPKVKKGKSEVIGFPIVREMPHRKVPSWLNCYDISKNFPTVLTSTL